MVLRRSVGEWILGKERRLAVRPALPFAARECEDLKQQEAGARCKGGRVGMWKDVACRFGKIF